MKTLSSFVVVAAIATPLAVSAQGLAGVAKKEEERRKTVQPGKVYKNGDLKTDITSSPATPSPGNASPQAPATPAAPAAGAPPAPAPGGKADGVKDEAYWRARITTARSALERSRIFADALQSRLNALTTDKISRDDPAQRAQLELEHQRAAAELDRVKKEIADQTKAIADIEEEARRANVPPGWLR
jgi:hypothetical protein